MSNNLFGTDGIRARVGTIPFTSTSLPKLGSAIAQWALEIYGKNPSVLIGQDTRASGSWISAQIACKLLMHNVSLFNASVITTPALCKILKESEQFDFAIMISASHNPAQDNGIKIINTQYGKISSYDEKTISKYYAHLLKSSYSQFGTMSPYLEGHDQYSKIISRLFSPNFLRGVSIGLDCAHGATYQLAPEIFKKLGATVHAINIAPNGSNINLNCGAVHLQQLQKLVIEKKLDYGFAFDGDGDRVIAVNRHGIIKNGDDMLALLSTHGPYKKEKSIVGTVMSNVGLSNYLAQRNKKLLRTPVGDKYVAEQLDKRNLLLGGEQSGHIVLHDYLPTGDGIVTALKICEALLETDNKDMDTFAHYPQILMNMPVSQKKDLESPEIASIIKDHEKLLDSGRLLVRYSGTENLLRIMAEDRTYQSAEIVVQKLAHALNSYL